MMHHVLGYSWYTMKPRIKLDTGMSPIRGDVEWKVGERVCIGYFDGKKRVACPLNSKDVWKCSHCSSKDVFFPCVKCDGSKCINPARRDECMLEKYVVYLAVFGTVLKVGISREERKKVRFVEQGADFVAEVRHVTDGMLARKIEAAISRRLGIVDRIGGRMKNGMLFSDPNISIEILQKALQRLGVDGVIHDMRSYYGEIDERPEFVDIKTGTEILGKIKAVKGNLMIVENGVLNAYNLNSLKGRMVDGNFEIL